MLPNVFIKLRAAAPTKRLGRPRRTMASAPEVGRLRGRLPLRLLFLNTRSIGRRPEQVAGKLAGWLAGRPTLAGERQRWAKLNPKAGQSMSLCRRKELSREGTDTARELSLTFTFSQQCIGIMIPVRAVTHVRRLGRPVLPLLGASIILYDEPTDANYRRRRRRFGASTEPSAGLLLLFAFSRLVCSPVGRLDAPPTRDSPGGHLDAASQRASAECASQNG